MAGVRPRKDKTQTIPRTNDEEKVLLSFEKDTEDKKRFMIKSIFRFVFSEDYSHWRNYFPT